MRLLAIALACLCSFTFQLASAKSIRVVTGSGMSSGSCDGRTGNSCISGLQFLATNDAERDASRTCKRSYNGRPIENSRSCSANCSPSYIPPYGPPAYVNCRARCNMNCEVN